MYNYINLYVIINIGDDMKKIIYFIMFILLVFIFTPNVYAAACDTDKITISSIDLEQLDGTAIENEDPEAEGKDIAIDLSMGTVGDYAKYKIVVKNDSEDDFEFNKTSLNINTDYIDYEFEAEDNSTIVKAHSTKTLYLRVNYKNEVPVNKFTNGVFDDSQVMDVNLSANDTLAANPITGTGLYLYIIIAAILIITGIVFITFGNKKYAKYMVILFAVSLIIPIGVSAICSCNIKVRSKVKINSLNQFRIDYVNCTRDDTGVFPYVEGMTWREYLNSPYYQLMANKEYKLTEDIIGTDSYFSIFFAPYDNCRSEDECERNRNIDLDSVIRPWAEGFYQSGDYLC